MKPINYKSISYAKYNADSNAKDPTFRIGNQVRISKYKSICICVCTKAYVPNWSWEVFVISKTKNTLPWAYFINDLNGGKNFSHS